MLLDDSTDDDDISYFLESSSVSVSLVIFKPKSEKSKPVIYFDMSNIFQIQS